MAVGRTVVLGVGNILLKDEGFGVRVVQEMEKLPIPSRISIVDGGTGGLLLTSYIDGADRLIIVDAVDSNSPPGSLSRFTLSDVRSPGGGEGLSLHETGPLNVLQLLLGLGRPIPEVVIWGAQPRSIDWGIELTPEVARSVPIAVEKVLGELDLSAQERLKLHLAIELGASPDDLAENEVRVVFSHRRDTRRYGGYKRPFWAVRRLKRCVASVSPDIAERASEIIEGLGADSLFSDPAREDLKTALGKFGEVKDPTLGPHLYCDEGNFRPNVQNPCRRIDPTTPPISALVLPNGEGDVAVFGVEDEGILASAAWAEESSALVQELNVWTMAGFEGRRYEASALSALARYILDSGKVPVYMVDRKDRLSLELAKSLGFLEYCEGLHFAVKSPT
ncbi:MAG: HyaD/HybD family hydrogenase maturation endopeptidase [bacterium]